MKYNAATLNKIEKIFEESKYSIRYERGTFQSGYCVLEAKKVVVLNKFLNVESRINVLMDLLPKIFVNSDLLTRDSQVLYDEIIKKTGSASTNATIELSKDDK